MAYLGTEDSVSGFHRCLSATVALNLVIDSAVEGPATLCFGTDGDSQAAYDTFMDSLDKSPHTDWFSVSIDQLRTAKFPIYTTTQRTGDLVVFPAATAHQVLNLAPVVTKAVWNILHGTSVDLFMSYIQPAYQRLCHPDTARVHLAVLASILELNDNQDSTSSQDMVKLLYILKNLIDEEEITDRHSLIIKRVGAPEGTVVECNFCGLAIWNRHLHCQECTDFDLCMYCYSMGRSCKHVSSYCWVEAYSRDHCLEILTQAQRTLEIGSDEFTPRE